MGELCGISSGSSLFAKVCIEESSVHKRLNLQQSAFFKFGYPLSLSC